MKEHTINVSITSKLHPDDALYLEGRLRQAAIDYVHDMQIKAGYEAESSVHSDVFNHEGVEVTRS